MIFDTVYYRVATVQTRREVEVERLETPAVHSGGFRRVARRARELGSWKVPPANAGIDYRGGSQPRARFQTVSRWPGTVGRTTDGRPLDRLATLTVLSTQFNTIARKCCPTT
eukprot:755413-Hanusia_phi.AAC.7